MTPRSFLQLVAWPAVLALFAVGCSSGGDAGDRDPCAAFLNINLVLEDDTVIDQVTYEISGNGMDAMRGTIDTSAPGATASVEVFGIPPGEGYVVTMVAESNDGTLMCGGTATFDVEAGVSTNVMLILQCKGAEQFGGVRVNGKLNVCSELSKVVVAPLQTSTGFAADVSALAGDEEGDTVSYRWTATGGSFDDPSAASTRFVCGDANEEEVTVEASDDDFEYCADSWTVSVNCVDDGGSGGAGGTAGSGGSGTGGTGGGVGGSGGTGMGGAGGGVGGSGGTGMGGMGGSGGGIGGSGGTGMGGSGGDGSGGAGGSGMGGSGGDGSGGAGGTAGGSGGNGTGGSGGDGNGMGGEGGGGAGIPPECLVSLSVQ